MKLLKVALWAEALVGPPTGTRIFLENLIRTLVTDYSDRVAFTLACPSWSSVRVLNDCFSGVACQMDPTRGRRWPNRIAWLAGAASITRDIGRHDLYLSGWQWPLGRQDEPFVGIVHDLRMLNPEWRDDTVSWMRRAAWRAVWDLSVRSCVARAAAIVTPSQFTLDQLSELGYVPEQPTFVIPHGVDQDLWRVDTDNSKLAVILDRIGASSNRDYILSVGQHTPHKNLLRLVDGFANYLAHEDPAAQLVLVGGENAETHKIRARVLEKGLTGRVILAGVVGFDDLRILMKRARVFAFPSLFEGFGLPVLEAFAAGTPVITSKTTSLGEIAGDAAVLVDPEDVCEIGRMIARVWHDKEERSRLTVAGCARARQFRWKDAAKRYLEVFEIAAGSSKGKV